MQPPACGAGRCRARPLKAAGCSPALCQRAEGLAWSHLPVRSGQNGSHWGPPRLGRFAVASRWDALTPLDSLRASRLPVPIRPRDAVPRSAKGPKVSLGLTCRPGRFAAASRRDVLTPLDSLRASRPPAPAVPLAARVRGCEAEKRALWKASFPERPLFTSSFGSVKTNGTGCPHLPTSPKHISVAGCQDFTGKWDGIKVFEDP